MSCHVSYFQRQRDVSFGIGYYPLTFCVITAAADQFRTMSHLLGDRGMSASVLDIIHWNFVWSSPQLINLVPCLIFSETDGCQFQHWKLSTGILCDHRHSWSIRCHVSSSRRQRDVSFGIGNYLLKFCVIIVAADQFFTMSQLLRDRGKLALVLVSYL